MKFKRGIASGVSATLAAGVSELWSTVNGLSRQLVRQGVIKPVSLGCRVVSVGNIQAGGAGKTPLVALIGQQAHERGLKVCILTRGYRSEWENSREGGVILPGDQVRVNQCGDEAAVLHDLCPRASIGVGHNRAAQYHRACARAGSHFDLVVLDDGFQNFKIKKDLEIVALSSSHLLTQVFRDRVSALSEAHLLVWTKGESRPEVLGRPLVEMSYELEPSTQFQEKGVLLVTGVADGASVARSLADIQVQVHEHLEFGDHCVYSAKQVKNILAQARAKGLRVALTGKDWVKWRDLGVRQSDVLVFEPRLKILSGEQLWRTTLW